MPILPPRYQCDFCDEIYEAKLGGDHWTYMMGKGWSHAGFDGITALACPDKVCSCSLKIFKLDFEHWHMGLTACKEDIETAVVSYRQQLLKVWLQQEPAPDPNNYKLKE